MKNFVKILLIIAVGSLSTLKTYSQVDIDINVGMAPPPLPEYAQPPCPFDGYIWSPGYWAYNNEGYYWVPGVWVSPPQVGVLWTPGYWYFNNGYYRFRRGYWGPHVGYYGGVRYGYGYFGSGFVGGMWRGNRYHYNTAVVNVNKTVVHNTYINKTVINNNTTVVNNRNSFNGPNGINAKPTAQEETYVKEQHVQPTKDQDSHEQVARKDKSQFASENNGKPSTVAMNKIDGDRFDDKGKPGRPNNNKDNIKQDNQKGNNLKQQEAVQNGNKKIMI